MNYIQKFFGHLKTVCVHKWWVFYYCCKFGMPITGLLHDLSKFSPTEFFESVKYYSGTRSPIDACKEDIGWSRAWMHHKGRNKHHYEYWQDNFDNGGVPLQMPFKYNLEMLCDYLGAGRAYNGKKFTYEGEYKWWLSKTQKPLAMHPVNRRFIDKMLYDLTCIYIFSASNRRRGRRYTARDFAEHKYKQVVEEWNNGKTICNI